MSKLSRLQVTGAGGLTCMLHVLNALYLMLGLGLTAAGLWFFVHVNNFTNLRDWNHYLLKRKVYFPHIAPWMYVVAGLFVGAGAALGFVAGRKTSKSLTVAYATSQAVGTLLLIAAAATSFVFVDSKETDYFIRDTLLDAFNELKSNKLVEDSFANIERTFQCCGVDNPRDYYKNFDVYPASCCDNSDGPKCSISSAANNRHGCSVVVEQYARYILKVLAGACACTAFLGLLNVGVATSLAVAMSKRKHKITQHQHSDEKRLDLAEPGHNDEGFTSENMNSEGSS